MIIISYRKWRQTREGKGGGIVSFENLLIALNLGGHASIYEQDF